MVEPFPPECPPDDAVPMAGTFYRFAVRGLAVGAATTDACWLRPYETKKGELFGKTDKPEAHALSVLASRDDVEHARDINPLSARKPVAEVTITEDDGRLKSTPTAEAETHHDWWTEPVDLIPQGVIIEGPREEAA